MTPKPTTSLDFDQQTANLAPLRRHRPIFRPSDHSSKTASDTYQLVILTCAFSKRVTSPVPETTTDFSSESLHRIEY